MKFSWASSLVIVLAASEAVGASSWFSKAVYNKWHETELERWLSDHNIPYPTPADRKELESLVKSNWEHYVQVPLTQTSNQASSQIHNAKEWVFDTWSDSQLKAFLDRHGIPAPQPRKRDPLLRAVRENYEAIAKKLGETASYPGNWLYEHWSDSDLKQWLDERGWPVPQPTTRDRLIAAVRRQSHLAALSRRELVSSLSSSAAAAQKTLSDALFNAWSDSELKAFLDKHGVKVPQGSRRNELIALARRHRENLLQGASSVSSSVTSAYGAATSKAGNEFARAIDDAELKAKDTFDAVVSTWSDSRLKAFLDARGVPVPQASKRDELLALVRKHKHKAAHGYNVWTFDTWTTENLRNYLSSLNVQAAKKAGTTRDELLRQAREQYTKASKTGGDSYASATSLLAQVTGTVKDATFDTWSESELKKYLDSYGLPAYQGSDLNELRAAARRNAQYFHYGTTTPGSTIWASLQDSAHWLLGQLRLGALSGRTKAQEADEAQERREKIRSEL